MSVLASEDEIEELASELVDIAKVLSFALAVVVCPTDDERAVADRRLRWVHLGALEPAGRQQKKVSLGVKTLL